MTDDLVTGLLPGLARSSRAGFNVFDVMRHGTHEKQISNVFGWLLDADGTHGLGNLFQRIFVDEVNRHRPDQEPFGHGPSVVRQEVNTSTGDDGQDIADLILESARQRLVIENYFTSDGHGHSYADYKSFSQTEDRRGAVVLLCRDEDSSRLDDGWENATVVTYGQVVTELHQCLDSDYARKHPESYSFIDQLHRKFVAGRGRMEDSEVLEFVTVMCDTGEALRYREKDQDAAKLKFADDIATQAVERLDDGRELLQRIKGGLRTYCARILRTQLNETYGSDFITKVSARYSGIYQWTINFDVESERLGGEVSEGAMLQVKFGPSALHANEHDPHWRHTVAPEIADYSHLFLTARSSTIRQSAVTLTEVLDGLAKDDHRLHDEIAQLLKDSGPQPTPRPNG